MTFIRTVCGDIYPSALGVCYPHEHVLCSPPATVKDRDLEMDSEAAAIQELTWFHQAGGRALVELSPADYGRNAAGLVRVSQATGVHIVCVTGHHKAAFSSPWVHDKSIGELADRFTRDVTEGLDGTSIKAGAIKAASSLNVIELDEEKVFRAAAYAHRLTGAPLTTHTEAGTMGLEQIALLLAEGVEPRHITIGHVDRKLEWDYHVAMLKTGVTLSYDQISKEKYVPDSQRVDFIVRLVKAGFGQQIVLGGDLARKSYWPSYGTGGGPGLTYILWRFVPWLRSEGVREEAIQDLLVNNPARILTMG
ncbi:Phosphotriesterase homology protein [Gammaproteobacteria bacterium]|nr:Phosphotriesterase homology protein [Gammaproteobacteria bacterium]